MYVSVYLTPGVLLHVFDWREWIMHVYLGVSISCRNIQRDATQRDVTQRDATQRDATQRDATQTDATQRDATQTDATQKDDIVGVVHFLLFTDSTNCC